jgi:hypothetical protein
LVRLDLATKPPVEREARSAGVSPASRPLFVTQIEFDFETPQSLHQGVPINLITDS